MEQDTEMDDFIVDCVKFGMNAIDENEDGLNGVVFIRARNEIDLPEGANPDGKPQLACVFQHMAPDKDAWYRLVGEAVRKLNAKFSVMLCESWVSQNVTPDNGGNYRPPSEDPNRTEALTINGVEYDTAGLIVRTKMVTVPFTRENECCVFDEDNIVMMSSPSEDNTSLVSVLADMTGRDDLA